MIAGLSPACESYPESRRLWVQIIPGLSAPETPTLSWFDPVIPISPALITMMIFLKKNHYSKAASRSLP